MIQGYRKPVDRHDAAKKAGLLCRGYTVFDATATRVREDWIETELQQRSNLFSSVQNNVGSLI